MVAQVTDVLNELFHQSVVPGSAIYKWNDAHQTIPNSITETLNYSDQTSRHHLKFTATATLLFLCRRWSFQQELLFQPAAEATKLGGQPGFGPYDNHRYAV